jgi:hypothetical protein
MRLKNKHQIPYGYWSVKDRLSGQLFKAVTWDHLLSNMIQARRANGLPVGLEFESEVESWAALDHPDESENYDERLPKKRRIGLDDIIRGTKVMATFTLSGRQLVPREEAERRASICAACFMNQSFSKPCSGICNELKELVLGFVGNQSTTQDSKLFACGVCNCFLQAAVWLPLETQCVGVTEEMRGQFNAIREQHPCWKNCSLDRSRACQNAPDQTTA